MNPPPDPPIKDRFFITYYLDDGSCITGQGKTLELAKVDLRIKLDIFAEDQKRSSIALKQLVADLRNI